MPCAAAGHHVDTAEIRNFFLCQVKGCKIHPVIISQNGIKRIGHCLGLLMDLLHHEMLKTALFGRLGIPGDLHGFFLNLITVQIVKMRLTGSELCKLQIVYVIYAAGIFQDSGNIGGHIGLTVGYAYDHGAVFSGHPDLTGIILEHKLQRITSAHTHHGLCDGVDGS